jgi:hypothetical protein
VESYSVTFEAVSAFSDDFGKCFVEWVTEANVAHYAPFEESEWSDTLGAIDDLIWNHEVAGLDFLLQGTYCGESDDCSHAYLS